MSSAKKDILARIKAIPKEDKPLPQVPLFEQIDDCLAGFQKAIETNKGEVISQKSLNALLNSGTYENVYAAVPGYEVFSNIDLPDDPHDLAHLHLAILKGQFGVAENGAIWLEDSDLGHRVLPFITEHLVILLDAKNLVSNMHYAYERIGSSHSGFGLFIAGPSKTADIEQSLVIGAHGAKSLRVVLL